MLNLLEVIWIYDDLIEPPHPKMVACINPNKGWFFRINSRDRFRPCVQLVKTPNHEFLDHDSYIHCEILELDDYVIEGALDRQGVIGIISAELVEGLKAKIIENRNISESDTDEICNLLG